MNEYAFTIESEPVAVSARVSRVATSIGDVAVKRCGDVAVAAREASLLAHLADKGTPTQALVRTRSGALTSGDVLVTSWEAGTQKSWTEISDEEWRVLGATLARLHAALDDAPAMPRLFDVVTQRNLTDEHVAIEAERGTLLIERYLDDRAALLEHAAWAQRWPDVPEGVVHNDYNQFNYLFREGAPPLVLDWDRALVAPREYEVVRCMNHLPLVQPASARAFVAGYAALRPLDRAALAWAVHAALAEHACKRWPIALWRRDPGGQWANLGALMQMVRTLVKGRAELVEFWSTA